MIGPLPRIGTFDDLPADHFHTCLDCGEQSPCDSLECEDYDGPDCCARCLRGED
jgi:hypothetical protein